MHLVIAEPVSDRISPIPTEILAADFDARWSLAAFILRDVKQVFDPTYEFWRMAPRTNLIHVLFFINTTAQDVVQSFIRREAVLVFLIVAQFGRRRFCNDPLWDDFACRSKRARWMGLITPA